MAKHVAWDDSFKVGHQMIDSQHKRLFEIADELYNLTQASQERKDADTAIVLEDCAKYVNFHFGCEEKLMEDSAYGDIESHINQHKAFTSYVATLMSDFGRGNKVNLDELYDFIAEWLVNHICSEDKNLASHANKGQ